MKEELLNRVLAQIAKDVELGDLTAVADLIVDIPDDKAIQFLPEEAMGQLKQQHTDWDNENTPEPPLTRDEILKAAMYWARHGGSFHQSLGKALIAADKDNLAALLTGFENQIRSVLRYEVEHI